QVDGGLIGDIAVSMRHVAGYADVVAGVCVAPLQAVLALNEHLLGAGQNEEVLGVRMAVQRHELARWHGATQHAELVGPAEELDDAPEDVEAGARLRVGESMKHGAEVGFHVFSALSAVVLDGVNIDYRSAITKVGWATSETREAVSVRPRRPRRTGGN